jgi:hypothetical protein
MAAAKKARTPAQVRERRARIAAVVLGVVFLGVAAIQVPKLMKQLKGAGAAQATEPVVSAGASGGTPVSATAQNVGVGQLTRFSHFEGKDPFKALISTAAGAAAQTAAGSQSAPAKLAVVPPPAQPSVAFAEKPTGPTVPAALILYNGKKIVVPLGFGFPAKRPVFRLITLGVDTARIGLVGASFADGKTTLPLHRGRKVSLSDSTTGDKFVLRLVKLTTAPAPKASKAPAS